MAAELGSNPLSTARFSFRLVAPEDGRGHNDVVRFVGAVFLLLTILAGGIALLWAYGKAFGTEWDICPGGECYSGWFGVTGFAALTIVLALAAWRPLRRTRHVATDSPR